MFPRRRYFRPRLLQIRTSLVASGLTSARFQVSTGEGDTATERHTRYVYRHYKQQQQKSTVWKTKKTTRGSTSKDRTGYNDRAILTPAATAHTQQHTRENQSVRRGEEGGAAQGKRWG